MDLKAQHLQNPLDTHVAFSYAESLLQQGDFRSLESFFRSTLSKTLDLNIWSLYLKYVGLQNPSSVLAAYAHMLSIMWFHYDIYDYVVEYIRLLDQDVDKIREVYTMALSNPIHNLSALFQQYEAWELSLSRATYKSLVNERLPAYQGCFKLYQKLHPFISSLEFDNVFRILELEPPNRRPVLAKYFKERFYYKEEVYFLDNEISPDRESLREGIRSTGSAFLRMYFSVYYDDTEVLDLDNDLEMICYLNILGKRGADFFHEALRSFGIRGTPNRETRVDGCPMKDRQAVSPSGEGRLEGRTAESVKENLVLPGKTPPEDQGDQSTKDVRPYVLIYAARLEYSLTSDHRAAFEIFYSGINKAPRLNEDFLRFLVDINDVSNARAMFKVLERTEKMWDWMTDLEFRYGSFSEYKRLVSERSGRKCEEPKRQRPRRDPGKSETGSYQALYESLADSFSFHDLKIQKDPLLENFIKEVPKLNDDSIFRSLKSQEMIALLKNVEVF